MKYTEFRKMFFNKKNNKLDLLKSIKLRFDSFQDLSKFDRKLEEKQRLIKPLYHKALLGSCPFPKSIEQLVRKIKGYSAYSFQQEMNWQTLGFLKCATLINRFLSFQSDFIHNLCIGNYEKAREILEKIEKSICISYWSIESRFILDEFQLGKKANWETKNKFLKKNDDVLWKLGIQFFSLKAETDYHFYQYNDSYESFEKEFSKAKVETSKELKAYFRFKFNCLIYELEESDYIHVFKYENNSSIIDRYLSFVRFSQSALIRNSNELESFFLFELLGKLSEKINDIAIVQLLNFKKDYQLTSQFINTDVLLALDHYTNGKYNLAADLSKNILSKNSNYFELIEIYVKSLIEEGVTYRPLVEGDTLLNQIAQIFFNIFEKNSETDNSYIKLLDFAFTFNNSALGVYLYSMASRQLGTSTIVDSSQWSNLNSKFINPCLADDLYKNKDVLCNYINRIGQFVGNSAAVNTHRDFYTNYWNGEVVNKFNYVPKNKALLYTARSYNLLKNNDKNIEVCNQLLDLKKQLSPVFLYEIYSELFTSYLSNNDFRNGIITFVDAYLDISFYTKKMDGFVDDFLKVIIKEKFKNIGDKKNLIELPIFFKKNCQEKIRIKQSYELFLKANNCKLPSEFIESKNIELFEEKKVLYFLSNVCTAEILNLVKNIPNTYSVNQERIKICQFLAKKDVENIKLYNSEISTLTQKNVINRVIGKIDEGKIYVNEDKIKASLLVPIANKDSHSLGTLKSDRNHKEAASITGLMHDRKLTKEVFDRMVELQDFSNEYGLKYLEEMLNVKVFVLSELGNAKEAFSTYKNMFLECRDLFISDNQYGLDAYLSTRIRHGTLPNHIRSVFENKDLVTSETRGEYGINDYWEDQLCLSENKLEKIQESLAIFSKGIDGLSKRIKEELVQIRTEKDNNKFEAWFDFSFTETYMFSLYEERVLTFNDFIDVCFSELWKRTEICLKEIRRKFNQEICQEFIKLLDDLEDRIIKICEQDEVSDLLRNITLCKTEIQTLLRNIAKWFSRSDSSFEGEYELSMLAKASVQIIKNITPLYNFSIESDCSTDILIKGEYHQHFIDIMKICLTNMQKHSLLKSEDLGGYFQIKENVDNLVIVFKNNISKEKDWGEIERTFRKIKNNWHIPDANVGGEGGTGFAKIKKILFADLERKESNFNYNLDENYIIEVLLTFEKHGLN